MIILPASSDSLPDHDGPFTQHARYTAGSPNGTTAPARRSGRLTGAAPQRRPAMGPLPRAAGW